MNSNVLVSVAPDNRLSGSQAVPGDKSISHRAAMFAGTALGESRIKGLLESDDVIATVNAMQAMGADISKDSESSAWVIRGTGLGHLKSPGEVLDMGNSGTSARLLAGLIAGHPVEACLDGDASLRARPMDRITIPLSRTGAGFTLHAERYLPMTVFGSAAPKPVTHRLEVASAQVKSALLLAGLRASGTTRVYEGVPTRDHTEKLLPAFGAVLDIEDDGAIALHGGNQLTAADLTVPGDISHAAFPLAAALIVPGSDVVLQNVGINPRRAGLLQTLEEMGANVTKHAVSYAGHEPVADLHIRSSSLIAADVPEERVPGMVDEYPVLAVLCAFARGTSRLRGLGELRVKESDRLTGTAEMLMACGIRTEIDGDDLVITGQPDSWINEKVVLDSKGDHRMAMSGLVMGLRARTPLTVRGTQCIGTSFPGFQAFMHALGASISASERPERPERPERDERNPA